MILLTVLMLPGLLTVALFGAGAVLGEVRPYLPVIVRYLSFVLALVAYVGVNLVLAALFILATV